MLSSATFVVAQDELFWSLIRYIFPVLGMFTMAISAQYVMPKRRGGTSRRPQSSLTTSGNQELIDASSSVNHASARSASCIGSRSPRFPRLPSWQGTRLRVAPSSRPSAASATRLQVAPQLESMGCAGDGGPSIPESRMPQRSRHYRLAGCPVHLLLLERLRCSPWVAPRSAPSGFAGDGAPSRLVSRILRRCRLAGRQAAPRSGPSVSPTIRSTGCPASQIFRLRLVVSQVAPGRSPSGSAIGLIFRLPQISLLWQGQLPDLRVAPHLFASGRADGPISRFP